MSKGVRWVSSPDSRRRTAETSQRRCFVCSPTLQGLPTRLLLRDQNRRTTLERLCQQQQNKGKEIGDVKGWPSNTFINIRRKEIKVSNGEGEASLQKTAGSAYWQQRLVSNTHAITTHNKSIINALIKAWKEGRQKQAPGEMNSTFPTQ